MTKLMKPFSPKYTTGQLNVLLERMLVLDACQRLGTAAVPGIVRHYVMIDLSSTPRPPGRFYQKLFKDGIDCRKISSRIGLYTAGMGKCSTKRYICRSCQECKMSSCIPSRKLSCVTQLSKMKEAYGFQKKTHNLVKLLSVSLYWSPL